ncbi:MAG: hypothetical protein Fur006_50400 [Coleofasciculaceae cyanobacterium]
MPLFKDTQGEATLKLEGFDAADIGAIPLTQKGKPGGVASLGADGKVPAVQLPDSDLAELVQANLQAVDALADQLNSLPPPPTLISLGGEPIGAETRANAYTDTKIAEIPSPALPTPEEIGAEEAGAEARAKSYTDQRILLLPTPTPATLGAIALSAKGQPGGVPFLDNDGKVPAGQLPSAPTLTSLGGEPSGAETRAKAYTDSKLQTPTWITPTFQNGWSNYGQGFPAAEYCLYLGCLWMRGVVKGGTLNATIFTFPTGHRPLGTVGFRPYASDLNSNIVVISNGSVVYNGANAVAVYLNQVFFPVF